MFTGIIEEVGSLERKESGKIIIKSSLLKDSKIGDSIAINGICLTLTSATAVGFSFDFMSETAQRTTISRWYPGEKLNLERALPAAGRFDGHIVQGHIDGIGRIIELKNDFLKISCSNEVLDYVVNKGAITIDGISLTVIESGNGMFSVGIIPHTHENTNLKYKKTGDYVNLETDILGRYIKKYLNNQKSITPSFLEEHGFA